MKHLGGQYCKVVHFSGWLAGWLVGEGRVRAWPAVITRFFLPFCLPFGICLVLIQIMTTNENISFLFYQ